MGVLNWVFIIFVVLSISMTAVQQPKLTKEYITALGASSVVLVKWCFKQLAKIWHEAEVELNEANFTNKTGNRTGD